MLNLNSFIATLKHKADTFLHQHSLSSLPTTPTLHHPISNAHSSSVPASLYIGHVICKTQTPSPPPAHGTRQHWQTAVFLSFTHSPRFYFTPAGFPASPGHFVLRMPPTVILLSTFDLSLSQGSSVNDRHGFSVVTCTLAAPLLRLTVRLGQRKWRKGGRTAVRQDKQ